MKRFLLFLLLTLGFNCFANKYIEAVSTKNLEYHTHETYEVWYDTVFHNPAFVIWDLTFEDATLADAASDNRSSSFKQCGSSARHSDYAKTGFDRGHMCPNNDRDWSKESAAETFRMCNVCPQSSSLNRGNWKKYEAYTHELAKKYQLVTVACGPIYTLGGMVTLKGGVVVPDAFFKIFVINGKVFECYIFYQNNTFEPVTLSKIEELSNLEFKIKEN